jgi:hypothetical protein
MALPVGVYLALEAVITAESGTKMIVSFFSILSVAKIPFPY